MPGKVITTQSKVEKVIPTKLPINYLNILMEGTICKWVYTARKLCSVSLIFPVNTNFLSSHQTKISQNKMNMKQWWSLGCIRFLERLQFVLFYLIVGDMKTEPNILSWPPYRQEQGRPDGLIHNASIFILLGPKRPHLGPPAEWKQTPGGNKIRKRRGQRIVSSEDRSSSLN